MTLEYQGPDRRKRGGELIQLVRAIDERTKTMDDRTFRLESAVFYGIEGDPSRAIVPQISSLNTAVELLSGTVDQLVIGHKPKANGNGNGHSLTDRAKAVGAGVAIFVLTILGWLGLVESTSKGGTP